MQWSARLTADLGNGPEFMIAEQPDARLPWGLGCLACHRYREHTASLPLFADSGWAEFRVGTSSHILQLEDLLRHCNLSRCQVRGDRRIHMSRFHQSAIEHLGTKHGPDAEEGDAPQEDVPSVAQFRICYDVIRRATPSLGITYELECRRVREGGCDDAVPVQSSSNKISGLIAKSIAAALFEQDRQLLSQGKIVMAGIAQDARTGLELTQIRFVTSDFRVHTRMLALQATLGKTAIDKVADLDAALDHLCNKSPKLKTTLAAMIRVSTADGDSVAQSGFLRLAKEHGVIPNQQAVLCCSLHGSQRALEKCVLSVPQYKKLLDEFVLKMSGSSRSVQCVTTMRC